MRKFNSILLFVLAFGTASYAQEVTVNQKNQEDALAMIEYMQTSISTLNNLQVEYNLTTCDNSKTKEEIEAGQQNYVKAAQQLSKSLSDYPDIEVDFDLKKNATGLVKFMTNELQKDANKVYQKKANEKIGCEYCLESLRYARRLYQKGIKDGDKMLEDVNESIKKLAKAYYIELEEPDAEDEAKVDAIRDGINYLYEVNLGINSGVSAFNAMAKELEALMKNEGNDVKKLEASLKQFRKDTDAAANYYTKVEERKFNDHDIWGEANTFLTELKRFRDEDLDTFEELIKKKMSGGALTQDDANTINATAQKFNKIAMMLQKYQVTQNHFMTVILQDAPRR